MFGKRFGTAMCVLALAAPEFCNSLVASAEGDGGGGGGGDAKFTQADLDRVAATVRRETDAKYGDYAAVKEKAGKVDKLEADMLALKDQLELKDADATKKAEILAARAQEQSAREMKALQDSNAALTASNAALTKSHTQYKLGIAVGDAFAKSGVLQGASKHAQSAFLAEAELELAEDGSVKSVKYNGVPQKDLATASAAFLSANSHFKAAAGGGGGGVPPNGGSLAPDQLAKMSPEEQLSAGMSAKPQGGDGSNAWDKQA